jgi:UDP-4-amino-4,6-dideoxy-L-N-acetyl-beta-L-altrosamine transaminase
MTFIPYSRQYIDDEDIIAVVQVLKSDFITQGPKTPEFENKLAEYCNSSYAVIFNSGTSALHGAYFALGLKKGNEFITTPNTFVATVNAGLYVGAKPVFVDVEKSTGNIDTSKIGEKITEKTKLLVPVHYAGHPVDLEKISLIADKYNLFVVEDACHALGAKYSPQLSATNYQRKKKDWIKIGSCKYSDMTVLSFHPVKHITTGEGGAVSTNNEEYYEKLLMFRNHGITKDDSRFTIHNSRLIGDWYYEMQYLGFNYRMTDIQAALGISQLKKIDSFVRKRRSIADVYNKAFKDNPYFDIPIEHDYAYSSFHLYPIRLKDNYIDKKIEICSKFKAKGLGIQVHYIPVYWQPYYKKLGYKKGLCPAAEDFYRREISIPVYPAMKKEEIEQVIHSVFETFKEISKA